MIPTLQLGSLGRLGPRGGDPYWANVASLLHLDGTDGSTTITDEKGKTWAAYGNAQIDTAESQFGGASLLLDGTTDWIDVAASGDFTFGTGDFTVEAWFRPSSVSGVAILFDSRPFSSEGAYPTLYRNGSDLLWFHTSVDRITASGALTNSTWQHIAVTRASGSTKLFVAGTQVGSTYSDSTNYSNNFFIFGASSSGGGTLGFAGHIDEIRITKGTARYTGTFTPPTEAFPNG